MEQTFKEILASFKKNGMRITVQRKRLLALILKSPGMSPKELFYSAHKADSSIGRATVYRMVNSLQELGYIQRQHVTIEPQLRMQRSS